jgi:mRNA-degrading endonuclease RelE of RelBE toxin-antitoxin system
LATRRFEKEIKRLAKKYPTLKLQFTALISQLHIEPKHGKLIGNSCYKIRLAIGSKNKGKSGGARVITHVYVLKETVYLLSIYDKNEKADLKPNELKELISNLPLD